MCLSRFPCTGLKTVYFAIVYTLSSLEHFPEGSYIYLLRPSTNVNQQLPLRLAALQVDLRLTHALSRERVLLVNRNFEAFVDELPVLLSVVVFVGGGGEVVRDTVVKNSTC